VKVSEDAVPVKYGGGRASPDMLTAANVLGRTNATGIVHNQAIRQKSAQRTHR
jgi:hypothetical protein